MIQHGGAHFKAIMAPAAKYCLSAS